MGACSLFRAQQKERKGRKDLTRGLFLHFFRGSKIRVIESTQKHKRKRGHTEEACRSLLHPVIHRFVPSSFLPFLPFPHSPFCVLSPLTPSLPSLIILPVSCPQFLPHSFLLPHSHEPSLNPPGRNKLNRNQPTTRPFIDHSQLSVRVHL